MVGNRMSPKKESSDGSDKRNDQRVRTASRSKEFPLYRPGFCEANVSQDRLDKGCCQSSERTKFRSGMAPPKVWCAPKYRSSHPVLTYSTFLVRSVGKLELFVEEISAHNWRDRCKR